jgi:hypothetical protein
MVSVSLEKEAEGRFYEEGVPHQIMLVPDIGLLAYRAVRDEFLLFISYLP